ncbi:MAG: zinc ribbon domain-containing protein [Clostridiales bacterium]|nr:zinc ribbon domain-containing protein [Clostridiales bacterium]
MFCKYCGKINPDGVQKCKYCGHDVNQEPVITGYRRYNGFEAKRAKRIGTICGLFLGLIGLIIGLVKYDGYEQKEFLSGWLTAFFIELGIAVLLVIISSCYACLL